jgi:aquaporin TIP
MAKLVNKLVDSFDHDDTTPDVGCVRAVLAELVLTFLFVFTGVSAAMAAGTYLSVHPPLRLQFPSIFNSSG